MKNTFPNINEIKKLTKHKFDAKHPNCPQCTIGRNEKIKHKGEFASYNDEDQTHFFIAKNVTLIFGCVENIRLVGTYA